MRRRESVRRTQKPASIGQARSCHVPWLAVGRAAVGLRVSCPRSSRRFSCRASGFVQCVVMGTTRELALVTW